MKTVRTVLIAVFAAAGSFAQENYSAWGSMRELTLVPPNLATGVAKFPLLIRLTSAHTDVFTGSKGRGADLRFTKADLATRYKHKIERWDSAGRRAEIWVLVDSVRANENLRIKMIWNRSGAADSSQGTSVFDTANGFVGVWHLGNATASNPRPNEVARGPSAILRNFESNQGSAFRVYAPVAGVIGFADTLRGGSDTGGTAGLRDHIDLNNRCHSGYSDFSGGFHFSAWVYAASSAQHRFLEMSDTSSTSGNGSAHSIFFGNRTVAPRDLSIIWGGTVAFDDSTGNRYTPGVWHHLVFSKPDGNAPLTLYADGVSIGVTEPAAPLVSVLRNYAVMGRASTIGVPYFTGKFDEVRLSRKARSAEWVKLGYETQKPGAQAVTVGPTTIPVAGGNDFTGVADAPGRLSKGFSVRAAGRNVYFSLPVTIGSGRILIHDTRGRMLWTAPVNSGSRFLAWDGRAVSGGIASRGIYLARFQSATGGSQDKAFIYNP